MALAEKTLKRGKPARGTDRGSRQPVPTKWSVPYARALTTSSRSSDHEKPPSASAAPRSEARKAAGWDARL
jgi:hypothetical protein